MKYYELKLLKNIWIKKYNSKKEKKGYYIKNLHQLFFCFVCLFVFNFNFFFLFYLIFFIIFKFLLLVSLLLFCYCYFDCEFFLLDLRLHYYMLYVIILLLLLLSNKLFALIIDIILLTKMCIFIDIINKYFFLLNYM